MQRRCDAPHHVVTDEHGQDENGELREEVVAALGRFRRMGRTHPRHVGQHGQREEDEARSKGPSRHVVLPPLGWRVPPLFLAGALALAADFDGADLAGADLAGARVARAGLAPLAAFPPSRSATMALTMAPSRAIAVPWA